MDKFKAYQQQMEKALKAFEYTTEWADLVNALGKVNKVLLNYSQFSKIPCDAILGRRLAQCLHPGLPNGVQLKALETYDLLFKAIGIDNLMQELSKFSNGLFPLLSHADLNVKPALLDLYEVHFLPLNERLRPALDGFLIATLHGLEENTDFYQRTDDLLMKVCAGVGPEHFYGSLWRCILIDPSVRLHGMNFLITHFNKKRPLESQLHILGNNLEALIEAICVSLLDIRNVLVQRAALDVLLNCFPLHNQQIKRNDMIKLATGAVTVLLRRDTSLSRRLLAWIFNLDSSTGKKPANLAMYGRAHSDSIVQMDTRKSREQREKERKISYFDEYARPLLLEAFNNCLSDPSKVIDIPNCWSSLGDFWSYRLMICLIDHSELCELIIDDICLEILRALCIDLYKVESPRQEFLRTIRLLLTSMNISYLWGRVYNLLAEVCDNRRKDLTQQDGNRATNGLGHRLMRNGKLFAVKKVGSSPTDILELCAAYTVMMDCFPIENYVESAKEFLPKILMSLLQLMIDHCDILEVDEYLELTRIVTAIFEGISSLHQDPLLLKKEEAAHNTSLSQVPTQSSRMGGNRISLVTEDEEYLAEEASEPNNDSSTNNTSDEQGDKSASEVNISNQYDYEEKGRVPSLEQLIARFQNLLHHFVITRLLVEVEDTSVLYAEFSKIIERRYPGGPRGDIEREPLKVDNYWVPVFESLIKILALIAEIPIVDELVGSDQLTPSQRTNGITPTKYHHQSMGSANGIHQDLHLESLNVALDSIGQEQSQKSERMKLSSCRPYIQDLMLLSYRVDNIRINYASINLMLKMLSTCQLTLDPEFAMANQLVGAVMPSFSEELNASVVGDGSLMYERRSQSSTPTKDSRKRLLLTEAEFHFIEHETCWFSLAMSILWHYLSTEPMMWFETIELIQNMHNLTHQTLVCEDIICASLNSSDQEVAYEARRRFTLLFSLMKGDRSDLNLRHREFERPLFFMLDSLANKMDPYNCIAKDWLTQVYKFRTTSRVLEPILKILLHPDTARTPIIFTKINISNIHHTHMHLYSQVYDSQRILYALNTLWNVLMADPHQGLIRMANSSIKTCHELNILYARHCNAQAGNNFHDDISIDQRGGGCGSGQLPFPSFLELTIVTCLNFLSSYYMQIPSAKLSEADLHGNQKVRMLASEILRIIFSNLFDAIKGCPTHPIHDMLNRCKAQEIVLLHIATAVQCAQHNITYSSVSTSATANNHLHHSQLGSAPSSQVPAASMTTTATMTTQAATSISSEQQLTTEQLIHFNETSNDNPDDFQRTLLRLLEELMILEYRVAPPNVISETENHSRSARTRDIPDITSNSLKYFYNILISSQRLFLSAVKAALQNIQRSDLHVNWLSMIESTIPISGRSLTRWIGCIISRLCDNLEMISNCILLGGEPKSINLTMTPKYLSILMNSLSHLAHYCLLDANQLAGSGICGISGIGSGSGGGYMGMGGLSGCSGIGGGVGGGYHHQSSNLSQRSESLSTLLPSSSISTATASLSTYGGGGGGGGGSGSGPSGAVASGGGGNSGNNMTSGSTTTLTSTGTSGPSSLGPVSHVVSNILHVFSNDQSADSGIGSDSANSSSLGQNDPLMMARKEVLNKLSQIFLALIQVWKAMGREEAESSWVILGSPGDVKKQILSLLSPISLRHGVQFMTAVAYVWHELRFRPPSMTFVGVGGMPYQTATHATATITTTTTSTTTTSNQVMASAQPNSIGSLASISSPLPAAASSTTMTTTTSSITTSSATTQIPKKEVIPTSTPDQMLLVEIVASISDLPMESVLQTTRQVISKTSQESSSGSGNHSLASAGSADSGSLMASRRAIVPLEVGLLQFFLAYIRLFPGSQLIECWKPLLHLLRDGLQLGKPAMPQAQFTLLALLHEFVQTAPLIEDRKDQKDLQDVAQKLIDSLTTVVGARLAQSRWLRRAPEVEAPAPEPEISASDLQALADGSEASEALGSAGGGGGGAAVAGGHSSIDQVVTPQQSYTATTCQVLNALAEYVAPVLDVIYASDEKEKVVNLINGIMYYVNPYLKNHDKHNAPSFLACSHLLSSISGYQYTRKAWRKDALELLLDPQFFQMDSACMEHWRVIVDHLMTHDKTTFRDFLARMSVNQSSGALKLFASRDQESEQRAQLIKRMAFILFCSERDQYHKYTPEIQEKLIESLRDNPSDLVQSQIMLCFRVLIIRSSAHLLTSLWPFVYTEMVQGLLDIEAYLDQSVAAATASNADPQQVQASLQVGISTSARFQLFLNTCKLLDMVLALPADSLPQFQMYRWSFIGAGDDFEPHLVRIERRLSQLSNNSNILPYRNHYPILTLNKISNLLDLHPFFKTLVKVNRCEYFEQVDSSLASATPTADGTGSSASGNQQQHQQHHHHQIGASQATTTSTFEPQALSSSAYDDPNKFIDAILESDFLVH